MKRLFTWLKDEYAHLAPGVGLIVTALVQNKGGLKEAVTAGAGTVLATACAVVRDLRKGKVSVASIESAGSDVAKALPSVRSDLDTILPLAQHLPALTALVSSVQSHVGALESKVEGIPGVDELVSATEKALLAKIATPST